jgi:hypothetical protein
MVNLQGGIKDLHELSQHEDGAARIRLSGVKRNWVEVRDTYRSYASQVSSTVDLMYDNNVDKMRTVTI